MNLVILSMLLISSVNNATGADVGNCEGMNHPLYKDEYSACKEVEKKLVAEAEENCKTMDRPEYQEEYKACLKLDLEQHSVTVKKHHPCESMNQPKYQEEYKACLKLEIETSLQAEAACAPTKNLQSFYSTFISASAMRLLKQEQSVTSVYKAVDSDVSSYIRTACSEETLDKVVNTAKQICYESCDKNSESVLGKKKGEAASKQCSAVCDMTQFAHQQFIKGMANAPKRDVASDCSNATADSISNLQRDIKKLDFKSAPAAETKRVISK